MKNGLWYFLFLFAICSSSCSNNKEVEQKNINEQLAKSAKNIKNPVYTLLLNNYVKKYYKQNDTLLLGYVLGWTREEVLKYTNNLIEKGFITQLQKQTIPIFTVAKTFTAFDTIRTWQGYNYNFQFNSESKCLGFFNLAYENEKLSHLCFFITSSIDVLELEKFIEKRYNKPAFITEVSDNDYEYPSKVIIWLSGGKEIQLCEWKNDCYMQYSDIKRRLIDEKELEKSSLIKAINDSIEKRNLKIRAEKSPKSF